MIRRLLVGYLSITVLMLIVLEVPLGVVIYGLERGKLIAGVEHDAATIALYVEQKLETGDTAGLDVVVQQYRRQTNGRVVIVDANGIGVADSAPPSPGTRSFLSRPEVAQALKGKEVHGFRHSTTLHTDLLFVAVPVNSGGIIRGAVRISYPASYYDRIINRYWILLAGVGLLVLAVVTMISVRLARVVTSPIRDLQRASARLGEGDLAVRAPVADSPPEVRALSRAFNETAAKLERLVDSQRAFVADASHQLRTPLAALRLRLEILEESVPARGREDFEAAVAEVHRLSRLVDGLLALARADNMRSVTQVLDAAAIVEDRRSNWAAFAAEHDVQLATNLDGPVSVLMTPGSLEQVLDNLIANAIDCSPAGSTVTISAAQGTEWGEVHVVDEGPGMSPERRATAFTRFWKAPDTQKRVGGFGIGLAIVQQLVVNDGGEVELLEAPTGGVDAHIKLRSAARGPPPTGSRRATGRPTGRVKGHAARSKARDTVDSHAGRPA